MGGHMGGELIPRFRLWCLLGRLLRYLTETMLGESEMERLGNGLNCQKSRKRCCVALVI